jgi:hypothetical protein
MIHLHRQPSQRDLFPSWTRLIISRTFGTMRPLVKD